MAVHARFVYDDVSATPCVSGPSLAVWDDVVKGKNASFKKGNVFEAMCISDPSGCWARCSTAFDRGRFSYVFFVKSTDTCLRFGLVSDEAVAPDADWDSTEFILLKSISDPESDAKVNFHGSVDVLKTRVVVKAGQLVTVEVDLDVGTMHYRVESGAPCLICRGISGPVHPAFFNDGEIRLDSVRASPASDDLLVWDLDVMGENALMRGKLFESSCMSNNSGCWARLRTRFDSGQFSWTFTIRSTDDQLCFGVARSGTIPETADWKSPEFCLLRADNGATSVFGTVTKLSEAHKMAYKDLKLFKIDDRVTCNVDLASGTMHYAVNGGERRLAFSGLSGSIHIAVFNDGILRIDSVKVGLTNPPQQQPGLEAACYAALPFPRSALHPAHGCNLEYVDALDGHTCDVCEKSLEDGSRQYRCANHDFDLCIGCWTRQSHAISLAHPVPAAPMAIGPSGAAAARPGDGVELITIDNPLQLRQHRATLMDRK